MELIDILNIILVVSLIFLVVIFVLIGLYVLTILRVAKRTITRAESIAFTIQHVRSYIKLGTVTSLLRILDSLKKGGGGYGKSHELAS